MCLSYKYNIYTHKELEVHNTITISESFHIFKLLHLDGLVQERRNSIANALE